MAPKLRIVVVGMVTVAALLGATLPWHAQKTASTQALGQDTASVEAPSALVASVMPSPAQQTSPASAKTDAQAGKASEHTLEETPMMKPAAMSSFGALPSPPSAQRLRDEVTENPHVTPPCVLQFAAGWAGQMQTAKDDAGLADQLVTQAEQWVGDSRATLPVIQAICLKNTKLLAAAHQTLAQRYEAMRRRAGADVLRLTE